MKTIDVYAGTKSEAQAIVGFDKIVQSLFCDPGQNYILLYIKSYIA